MYLLKYIHINIYCLNTIIYHLYQKARKLNTRNINILYNGEFEINTLLIFMYLIILNFHFMTTILLK